MKTEISVRDVIYHTRYTESYTDGLRLQGYIWGSRQVGVSNNIFRKVNVHTWPILGKITGGLSFVYYRE